jgi:GT2 family glycosyltransferase
MERWSFRGLRGHRAPDGENLDSKSPPHSPQLLFSVVIPAYTSAASLERCLEGLTGLRYPRDRFEVIVSDDGSPTPLAPVAIPFTDRLRLRVVTHPNGGPGAARNRGAQVAEGTYLVFMDSDCIPCPEWLETLASRFARSPLQLICGGIVNALPGNPFSAATQIVVTFAHEYHARLLDGERVFNSSNIAMPADRFRQLGGFDESLRTAEDYDFCHRWQQAGYDVTHEPAARVYHAHELTFVGFWRQHFSYGRGLLRWRLRVARQKGRRLRGQRVHFYLGLLRFPFTRGQGLSSWTHALLVALSQAATMSGVLRELLATGWSAPSSAGASPSTGVGAGPVSAQPSEGQTQPDRRHHRADTPRH